MSFFYASRLFQRIAVWSLPLALIACSSSPLAPTGGDRPAPVRSTKKNPAAGSGNPALPAAGSGRGGYYLDDGPGDNIPPDLSSIPDAEPRIEPYAKGSNRPYSVFGKTYVPITDTTTPFKQRGVGSWYGKKFHGQKTSSGELYDMYKMTAAHPTLPLPSYARVTNLKTGAQVIVRINDRGPFHSSRIIDLSYTAALKLGYLGSGSSELEVERILPAEIERMAAARRDGTAIAGTGSNTTVSTAMTAQPESVNLAPSPSQSTIAALDAVPATSSGAAVAATAGGAPTGTATVTATGTAALSSGFYLQFGAYSQEANALIARTNLLQSLSGLLTSLDAVPVNGLYRLYAGPYASRAAAQEAAQLIRERGSAAPFIVENK